MAKQNTSMAIQFCKMSGGAVCKMSGGVIAVSFHSPLQSVFHLALQGNQLTLASTCTDWLPIMSVVLFNGVTTTKKGALIVMI